MTMLKRVTALVLALVFCGAMTASAAVQSIAVYTLTKQGNTFSMNKAEGDLTFWEAPDVTTGQSRTGGTITLKNETERTVDFVLSSVSLPYDNAAALTYLDAVTLHIAEGDKVHYHDSITHIMDTERAEIRLSDMAPGEERVLTLSINCAYTYSGNVPSYSSLVWTFTPVIQTTEPTTTPTDPFDEPTRTINWLLIAEIAGALVLVTGVAGVCVWLCRRSKRL